MKRSIPGFRSHLRVRTVPPDLVLFVHESGYRAIRGRLLFHLARLIDGKRTVEDIVDRLNGKLSAIDVACGLQMLQAEGYLTDAGGDLQPELSLYGDAAGVNPKLFARRLRSTGVQVRSFGNVPESRMVSILNESPLRISSPARMTVVLVDDYLCEDLIAFNRNALQKQHPWIIVKPVGTVLWIGPVFSPPETACWMCMARRLKEKRRVDAFVGEHTDAEPAMDPYPVVPFASDAALHLAALEMLKEITGSKNRKSTGLLTLDLKEMKLEEHTVVRREDCAECGTSTLPMPARISIKARRKKERQTTKNTFDRYAHHISFRTGIVDSLESYSTGPIHSVAADHLFVPAASKKNVLQKGLTQKSWGRGTTEEAARTGALCEALERYSGMFRGNEYRIVKSYADFPDQAVQLYSCLNFSEEQYKYRERWNRSNAERDRVPVPFDPLKQIEWSPLWSLSHETCKYLPTAYCYYGYNLAPESRFCRADSNGNAAGSTLEEAILNGFLEIVERDCAAVWWYNRIRRPAVDLDSFDLPYFPALRRYYLNQGRDLQVLDLMSDFQIPCFAAVSATRNRAKPHWILGLGASFDPAAAIVRALTEMNQFLVAGFRRRMQKARKSPAPPFDYLKPEPYAPAKTSQNYPVREPVDAIRDLKKCISLVKSKGMELLVLNQTRTDVGLPVVKVIVPGMRHIRPRFGPGRLYDVPVRLGRLPEPLKENELNPTTFLI